MAQTLSGEPAVPGIIPGGVAPQPLLKEAAMPGMASKIFLFTTGHRLLVYIRSPSFLFIALVGPIHTSGLVEASAWTVCRPP